MGCIYIIGNIFSANQPPSARERTATATEAAPAARRTRVISFAVAPVVRISSTSKIRRPRPRGAAPGIPVVSDPAPFLPLVVDEPRNTAPGVPALSDPAPFLPLVVNESRNTAPGVPALSDPAPFLPLVVDEPRDISPMTSPQSLVGRTANAPATFAIRSSLRSAA